MPGTTDTHLSAPITDADAPRTGPGWAVLYACFLGCSWTWVIGMFFPVLLLRDYGLWGWVVFAAPNVVGAAAMGFVLTPKPDSARSALALWRKHSGAVRWFSDVTLAFHVFVLMWLGTELFGPVAWAACAVPLLILPARRGKAWGPWLPAVAVGVTLLSCGCFSYFQQMDAAWQGVWSSEPGASAPALSTGSAGPVADAPGSVVTRVSDLPRRTAADLWLFVPASITGFLCCPYLDGSFLRARATTSPKTGRVAFAVGFGVVFFSMIAFSLAYAAVLIPAFDGETIWMPDALRIILGIHILVQAAFTMTLHVREREALNPDGRRFYGLTALLVVAFALVLLIRQPQWFGPGSFGVSWQEIGYRSFLLMYGLVFPAYVWLVVLRRPAVTRAALTRFFVTVLLAVPMGFIGFVTGPSWWLLGALGVITLAKLFPVRAPSTITEDTEAQRHRESQDG